MHDLALCCELCQHEADELWHVEAKAAAPSVLFLCRRCTTAVRQGVGGNREPLREVLDEASHDEAAHVVRAVDRMLIRLLRFA